MRKAIFLILCGSVLAGCEQLGIETPAQVAAARDAEGRAIGGACRHSGRALEDCYNLNKRASKAAIFSGWRDMDAYMRENAIEIVLPAAARREMQAEKSDKSEKAPEAPPPAAAPAPGSANAKPAKSA